MIISESDIHGMQKLTRVQFATTLPGPKPICLVGTRSKEGTANLAPFSSITHFGSNPILLGMVSRPDTVSRHTLSNIIATGCWTLNHVTAEIVEQAHQCSARYPDDRSEFEATGLTEVHHPVTPAPFVGESPIRMALTLEDLIDIPVNKTKLIIGRVRHVEVPDDALAPDGRLDISTSLASTALDTYLTTTAHSVLPYAKPS